MHEVFDCHSNMQSYSYGVRLIGNRTHGEAPGQTEIFRYLPLKVHLQFSETLYDSLAFERFLKNSRSGCCTFWESFFLLFHPLHQAN